MKPMTEVEFDETIAQMKIEWNSAYAIKIVVLSGKPVKSASEITGIRSDRINYLLKRFADKYLELRGLPMSWKMLTIRCTPAGKEEILKLAQLEKSA